MYWLIVEHFPKPGTKAEAKMLAEEDKHQDVTSETGTDSEDEDEPTLDSKAAHSKGATTSTKDSETVSTTKDSQNIGKLSKMDRTET